MSMKEAMAEIGQELANRGQEAKGFMANVMSEIGAEMAEQVKHGSHELAAALFKGTDGFVMYPHEGKQPEKEVQKEQEIEM